MIVMLYLRRYNCDRAGLYDGRGPAYVRGVRLRYLNVSTLLKDSPCLQSDIICLQVCEHRKSVPPLSRVLRGDEIRRERSHQLGKIPIAVFSRRLGKEWADEITGHQRLPSCRKS